MTEHTTNDIVQRFEVRPQQKAANRSLKSCTSVSARIFASQ